jgi:hypothetical protein
MRSRSLRIAVWWGYKLIKRELAVRRPPTCATPGRPLSAETRRKMSETHRRIGHRPPWLNPAWAEWEATLLAGRSIAEVAKLTGRTKTAVGHRRLVLGLPDGRRKGNRLE